MFGGLVPLLSPAQPIPGGPSVDPLHGSFRSSIRREHANDAARRARDLLTDDVLGRLLTTPREATAQVPHARDVFVNRNLRMDHVELIGFDMDYTLAIYHMRRLEQLSFDMTIAKLISEYGYPPFVGGLLYDHHFVMRGLAVDRVNGNVLKMDRFGHVGRAYHGLRPLKRDAWKELYRNKRVRLRNPQFAWNDTLFALPETCLYSGIIELMESLGHTVNYGKLYDDIREAIDTVHRDNSLKREIRKDLARYVFLDPELGPALHKLRSGGKRLFLLTNSAWDYTNAVMRYLLDGQLPEYPSWRNYFDFTVTAAGKPAFFTENRPFLELDSSTEAGKVVGEAKSLERGTVYSGGNLAQFEEFTGYRGEHVLYVGDHIYGDILKSKKSSLWRTCMIVQEIEDEITYTDQRREEIVTLSEVELTRARLDDEVNHRKTVLNTLERRLEREELPEPERQEVEELRKKTKAELEKLRRSLKETNGIADTLERDVEEGFNPYWGLLFKEGNENSRFGYQVEQYACLYTSRVSNFLHHSPMQYYRSPRDLMAHEQAGALSSKLSPMGSEGPPKGSSEKE
ncbi:HAD-IG family 5'-nucleotidase [Corallococcus carmarthensis]|uniref:HAD family hydrolase n=1 Tax=Corallococcus carmarthensis TaxID=2316728 RepID=A0A3A8K3T6_9BACT|nr:HAD-IG family 5'-nucleotidase [Corallococcus carmarthensis]NOK17452.1 HAD-IG family 5'-nucleotidase [Corallococcus carmarthensis]RKH02186.1 HAD family hydrolase [Corallococcus carmarthensis]